MRMYICNLVREYPARAIVSKVRRNVDKAPARIPTLHPLRLPYPSSGKSTYTSNLARLSFNLFSLFRIPYFSFRGKPRPPVEVPPEPSSDGNRGSKHAATDPAPVRLVVELIERIADFLFEPKQPTPNCFRDTPLCLEKPSWSDVCGFMETSAELHHMGLVRWLRVITIHSPDDWDFIYPHLHIIREIKCLDGALLDSQNQVMLSQIPFLCAASIDTHSDVWYDDNNRFAYRDIVPALPPSLKLLEVTNSHGPDIKVIATVKKHCPQLEVLRLGRCTMFNRVPECAFWRSFPHDHDAYISDSGIDTYAHSLGQELSLLENLRSLRMGLYLVPSDTVLAHRLYHRRGRDAPHVINWQTAIPLSELPVNPFVEDVNSVDPATTDELVAVLHQLDTQPGEQFHCPQCVETTVEPTRRAEKNASAILHDLVPSPATVEWMGWLTPGHLGIHTLHFPLTNNR